MTNVFKWGESLISLMLAIMVATVVSSSGVIDLGAFGGTPARVVMWSYVALTLTLVLPERTPRFLPRNPWHREIHSVAIIVAILVMAGRGASFLELYLGGDTSLLGAVAERFGLGTLMAAFHLMGILINRKESS